MTAPQTPVIRSLLDTDLYKFTMLQVVLHQFPQTHSLYEFRCRNKEMVYPLAKVKKGEKMPKERPPMAQAWRAMALTRKTAIHIPRRQFIGTSHELNVKIRKMILNTLIEIFGCNAR